MRSLLEQILRKAGPLLGAAAVVLLIKWFTDPVSVRLAAEDGVLDLRAQTIDRVASIGGEWRALGGIDGPSLATFDYDDSQWQRVQVSGTFEQQGFPNEGLVWYRLHLRLPAGSPPLKGYLNYAHNAHTLFVSRPGHAPVELATSGWPGLSPSQSVLSRRPVTFSLPADTAIVLSWKVANFDHLRGGPVHPILIGPAHAVDTMLHRRSGLTFASLGLYLFITLIFLLEWVWLRDTRALAVALLASCLSLHVLAGSGYLELLFPGVIPFEFRLTLEVTSLLAVGGLLAFLLWAFFPDELITVSVGPIRLRPSAHVEDLEREISGPQPAPAPTWVRSINTIGIVTTMVLSLSAVGAVLHWPLPAATHVLKTARWISPLLILFSGALIWQARQRRRPLAHHIAAGTLVLVLAGLHDLLLATGWVPGNTTLLHHGMAAFTLIQAFAVARRNARYAGLARRDAETLREEVERRTEELQAATLAAQSASIAKSQFVSAVSHELRTPLASILGYTQVLEEELRDKLQQHQREFFESIRSSGERLLALINDLLDIAKIEAGRMDLTLEPVAVRPLIEEVQAQMLPLAADKNLTLLRPTFEVGNAYVMADEMRLRQVLINLLSNAIKFTDTGCVGIRVFGASANGTSGCSIVVFDTGPGISPEFLPHLFKAFAQDSRTYGKTQSGTGLGLAISHELVTRMHGTITVQTETGVGSTFTVTLPEAEPASRDAAPIPHAYHRTRDGRVTR